MVRETRHLWVGNLPDNIREDRIREHFKRYGRVQSVKLLPRGTKEETSEIAMACTVAFMDIKSASKAHNTEHKLDDRTLTTEYYEPAAIPSSASPQNTPSSYSTSPSSTRFPNGHGSTEEHNNFNDRFYERPNNRVTEGEFIRRSNYHDNCRGRNRDRNYRNGPYNAIMDRSHRTLNNSWSSYDSTRYNSQNETGYVSTPSDSNEKRPSDQSTKKQTKSRSGSGSPSPSGSTSSRSPSRELQQPCDCRSRSRSSSSSSSSSTSRDTSSSSERRPLAICVKNLPPRSSDTSLKDGLFHEYKKHGKVTWVKVVGQGSERYAIVCFKKTEDVEKALEVSYDKLFFGCKIEVESYQGHDVEDNDLRPYEAEIDEFHPKATRTLFIGNLEKDVTASDLRKHFDQFGEIIEIDIKKQGAVGSYAFCQYSDIVSVVKAIRTMDGEHLGNNRIKLGFGKSMPTNCVWVDGIVENVNEKYLRMQFEQFGSISKVHVDRDKGQALIFYEQVVGAQLAVNKMRGFSVKGNKIQVDFASRECQESFFEHLEKQGTPLERPNFEERRDSVTRTTFESTTNRFTRYDTPTRPRTASYSSRSSATASQVTSAIPSPGTPGSVTPRGTSSRSRVARFSEYYDPTNEYSAERHVRSYDEYSQGSGASHEDGYEQEYVCNSPPHVDILDSRTVQTAISDHSAVPFAQPDIRNLQKERVHLLEQLEECPSSGDELVSPKKRLKLDLSENAVTSDVIIEANREHRKNVEVRRLSDPNIKHHSRRPSTDSKHGRDLTHERCSYLPHAVCKRRKTVGSDSGSRTHHYEHSGSESVGGSRPGTPLVDERPEHFPPSEPRRVPREREGPLTLPLPRFAAQVMNRGSVSVAGIKGQKDNILSSPPPAVTSPRISNPKLPSPVHVPPPASPPPRPPSLSSNSSDSDINPPSPSLDERIKSLDEKYEKWSGSRALSAAGGEALAKLDATREKFRLRHKLLDLDLKEVQPSEIVKSVMAKRSVFDEDLKRLENFGEKYEPKDFNLVPRSTPGQASIPAAPLSAPPILKVAAATQLPKTPTMLSPRSSAGANVTAAKGLQYPFPSHPPIQLTPPVLLTPPPGTPTTPTPPPSATTFPPTSTTSTITKATSHGDNRLKPCTSVSSDNRTSSKMNVNRSGVVSSLAPIKTNSETNSGSIPSANDASSVTAQQPTFGTCDKQNVKTVKTNDKVCDKIMCRRDSSSSGSPRGDLKTKNNEATVRRDQESFESVGDTTDENIKNEGIEQERLEKLEKEKVEKDRNDKEKQEKERLEKERLEREKLEREHELEKQRLEKEQEEIDRLENEKRREQDKKEQLRKEREEKEKREREEDIARERQEMEKRDREEKERQEVCLEREQQEKLEKARLDRDQRKKEEEKKLNQDNQEKRKDEQRHKENHIESKHRDNTHCHENKSTKEEKHRDIHENSRKDSHDSKISHDRNRHHLDVERRKESVKENRDNNSHDKQKIFTNETREIKDRMSVESRHISIDFDSRSKPYDGLVKVEANKRKERNNSLPANVGVKRRLSSHETCDTLLEDLKKAKFLQDHKKLTERRDSKDSTRSDEKYKSKLKNNAIKTYDDKTRDKHHTIKESDEKRKDRDDRHKSKQKLDKYKIKSKSREKDCRESPSTPKSPAKELSDKDFLARLDLRCNEEVDKQRQQRKENKDKKKTEFEQDEKRDREELRRFDDRCKKDKQFNEKCKLIEETSSVKSGDEKKIQKKDKIRRFPQNSSDNNTDSDEPRKHSIFDIVDDEPAYISMYDKVKARSCKNMQKQEEEKRQEKIKAKFSQLKQSRAKREEKKRSTSWDEDSDSDREHQDKSDIKAKRTIKMLIMSSDEEGQNMQMLRKRELYSDSDLERPRQIKSENIETSEDDQRRNKQQRKGSKSRITSDTSEDEMMIIQSKIKSEIYSDNEVDQGFADAEDKSYVKAKDEISRIVKREKDNNHQDSLIDQMNAQIFGDSSSPVMDIKPERFNNINSYPENSSDENPDAKKERSDIRKKHKKKQKRQKHIFSTEDSGKLEISADGGVLPEGSEKLKHHDKKKQHSRRDKKRDKPKEDRERSRKSKKNKNELKSESKRDGKMENIFGSLSEDSEAGIKESEGHNYNKLNTNLFLDHFNADNITNSGFASDSDREPTLKSEDKDRESKDEHKKRKEKKRREKERRLQEEATEAASIEHLNDNSMDYVDMGKQLEANIKDDSMEDIKNERDNNLNDIQDSFRFNDSANECNENKKEDRKEPREKKKKRKKSKEEKQKHHHHHHHDKNKSRFDHKIEPVTQVKSETEVATPLDSSLPDIFDLPNPQPQNKSTSSLGYSVCLSPRDSILSPIPKTPATPKDKKRDKFIPGFGGTGIDEKIHENAVKSISEFEPSKSIGKTEESKDETVSETNEEKPRVVISQEETEDAVAALLGESFRSGQFEECYNGEDMISTNDQSSSIVEDNIAQDDEEMRQAVQSLSSADVDTKPDTPQSEHELQIDTDTEEQEDHSARFDQLPKLPQIAEPPKTPEAPNFYRNAEQKTTFVKAAVASDLGNLPSLAPISPLKTTTTPSNNQNEDKKLEAIKSSALSLPILSEQPRSVISQSWNINSKEIIKSEPIAASSPILTTSSPKITTAIPLSGYKNSVVKTAEIAYPPLTPITKQEHSQTPSRVEQPKNQQTFTVLQTHHSQKILHNLPACSPVPQKSLPVTHDTTATKFATSNLSLNRLPVTPVAMSKPLQPTILLPQAKTVTGVEPSVHISSADTTRTPEKPQMVFHATSTVAPQFSNLVQSQPRIVIQSTSNISSVQSPNLAVPKQLPATSSYHVASVPHTQFNHSPTIGKEIGEAPDDSVETPKVTSIIYPSVLKPTITMSTQALHSTPSTAPISTTKSFIPVIKETQIRPSQSMIQPQIIKPPEHPKDFEKPASEHLQVSGNFTRTSTPSPVIVQAPLKEPIEIVKSEVEMSKLEETSERLAIEKVTDELNLTLKKEIIEETAVEAKKIVPEAESAAAKNEPKPETVSNKAEASPVSTVKETDEEKNETESIVSDVSKEQSSADMLSARDDPLDNKEDSDYWSAKEVNIDSVIKTLCSADELSDHSSDPGKDEWFEETKTDTEVKPIESTKKEETEEDMAGNFEDTTDLDGKDTSPRGRKGGRGRGRKGRGGIDRSSIQTRRSKMIKEGVTVVKQIGRGGIRQKGERKASKSESEATSTDVYEFRDDSDESNANKERPRLILTIKSPSTVNTQPIVKETKYAKEAVVEPVAKTMPVENKDKEEFLSPVVNTRKSRRLQERDVLRNTVDDTIEDVVKNAVTIIRSSANQNSRRSTRQAVLTKQTTDTHRKSPRGGKKKDRRASDPCENVSHEKAKTDLETKSESDITEIAEKPKENEKEEIKSDVPKTKPYEGLKASMLRRLKGDVGQEPMTLIDPVTGLLTPMRECEEGRYIPLPKSNGGQKSVIATLTRSQQQQQQKTKLQSFKAHVLSSQAAVSQQHPVPVQPLQKPQHISAKKNNIILSQSVLAQQASVVVSPTISQNLNANVSLTTLASSHLNSKQNMTVNVLNMKPSPTSSSQMVNLSPHQKQQIQQQVTKQQTPKSMIATPLVNQALTAHLKQQPQPINQAVISKAKLGHCIHPQQILTGSVASPPSTKGPISGMVAGANQNRIIQGPVHPKSIMEPPKIDVSNVILGPRTNLSPGQQRHIPQSTLSVPSYEASLHGERNLYNSSRSPPPAHQNSPSPQGEAIPHFPPGNVPLRPPHDMPTHYMHAPHVMPYQYLRQSYHLPRSPMVSGGLEKSSDGQEGEEAPVTSPPLELRRPNSVGLALSGRTPVVPHSLHSPHDRSTDSPQVGQVYNIHTARMQHYQSSGRYYEQTAEPPPAHRPLTSHGSLTALANDRNAISHMASLGASERPMSGHMQPDRPLSSHSALTAHMGGLGTPERPMSTHLPERPLSNHGLTVGAGLGAAGNLMGAVARHIGVDAPTSQRGIQAATPPHASQVPPQAESLFMLLKQYPCMWQGLLALKNDQAAVQMYFVSGNDSVAKCSLPKNTDGSTPPLRIFQRMRLEQPQVEGVARKMQMENEHCMLLALPCGHDHMDVLKQSTNLTNGFITYLQQKQAAGIVNVAAPGTTQPPAYVVHIFPSCDFVNENLRRIAPSLLERVADIAHLLIVITTV